MIYQVMQRIVSQTIPQQAINGADFIWKPYSNASEAEPYTRYERILAIAHAYFEADKYCPSAPTGIIRNFEEGVEIPAAESLRKHRTLLCFNMSLRIASCKYLASVQNIPLVPPVIRRPLLIVRGVPLKTMN